MTRKYSRAAKGIAGKQAAGDALQAIRIRPGVTLYFSRHGETEWNVAGRLQGRADVPINGRGRQQAARNGLTLAEALARPERYHFIASPLLRTRQTMEIIRLEMGLDAQGYATDERLAEMAFGAFEGLTWKTIAGDFPEEIDAREQGIWAWRPPGGESYADVNERLWSVIDELDRDTVMVSHGGLMRCLQAGLARLPRNRILDLKVPQDQVLVAAGDDITWL